MTSLWRLLAASTLMLSGVGTVAVAEPVSAAPPVAAARPVTAAAPAADDDILARLRAVPGLTVVAERPAPAPYRYFVLNYTQHIDHRRPAAGTFQQRLSLLHRGTDRPTVLATTGYGLPSQIYRSEPARLTDANQIVTEQRFFTPSRPEPADWSRLNIWQAATDHHRLIQAFKPIYAAKWLSTGASKGGMTSVYHRRFYPSDVDGTIAYVAPNDVLNAEDSAYDRFFARVGTAACRTALKNVQAEALRRRAELVPRYAAWAAANNQTFEDLVGDVDRAFEYLVSDAPWAFWQYSDATDCADVPPVTASSEALLDWLNTVNGFAGYTDEGNEGYVPYYYQAGTQLGSPEVRHPHLKGLLRYPGQNGPRSYVPRRIPMWFQPLAMIDVDIWVKLAGRRLMFVNGQNDPWGSEPFRLGFGTRDSFSYQAAGANHGANISLLTAAEQAEAAAAVRRWAGVTATATARQAMPPRIPGLDEWNPALERHPL